MSRLSSIPDFDREIAEVEGMIAAEERNAAELGTDPSSEMLLETLRARLGVLQRERDQLTDAEMPGQELDVIFSGDPVANNRIDASFLGRALQEFQSLVHAIVGHQMGHLRPSGSWPEEVLRRSRLEVSETFAGSFGVKFEALDQQLELEGDLAIQPAFEDLFNVLGSERTGADYLEGLAPIGNRARARLRDFFEEVAKAGAEVEVHWPRARKQSVAKLSAGRAQELTEVLKRLTEEDHMETRVGVLEGAILRTQYFELIEDEGALIAGRVSPDIRDDILEHFGQRVAARLLVTKVTDRGTGVTKETFRLMGLGRPEA